MILSFVEERGIVQLHIHAALSVGCRRTLRFWTAFGAIRSTSTLTIARIGGIECSTCICLEGRGCCGAYTRVYNLRWTAGKCRDYQLSWPLVGYAEGPQGLEEIRQTVAIKIGRRLLHFSLYTPSSESTLLWIITATLSLLPHSSSHPTLFDKHIKLVQVRLL